MFVIVRLYEVVDWSQTSVAPSGQFVVIYNAWHVYNTRICISLSLYIYIYIHIHMYTEREGYVCIYIYIYTVQQHT